MATYHIRDYSRDANAKVVYREPKDDHGRQGVIFMSNRSPTERLVLLAINYHRRDSRPMYAEILADHVGMHRVSVQRIVGRLVKAGVLYREDERLLIDWQRLQRHE